MNFLKKIWQKIRGIFIKRPPSSDKIISEVKTLLEQPINTNKIFTQIAESQHENERASLISLIAKHKTAESIIEFVEQDEQTLTAKKKGRKRLYELYELRTELQILEEKRAALDYTKSKIFFAEYPDTQSIERGVDSLRTLLKKNKSENNVKLSKTSISEFDKSFQQLEKLLNDKSTLSRHTTREILKQKQEEIYKNKIKQNLSNIENLISQNKLVEAKTLINLISYSIKPNLQKELARLSKAKEKYKEKELYNYKRQEEELLKKQTKQAEFIKEQEEKRFAELKLKKEQEANLKKAEVEKQNDKENKLKVLLNKKANWRDFQKVLQENSITAFYHFTDESNLKSIKENGGLFSWFYCDINNISIPMPGGSLSSRQNDSINGKKDFVRISFNKENPMLFIALKDDRITKAVWLIIDIEVAYFENTEFSDKNAAAFASYKPIIGKEISNLENIRFEILKKAQRVKHYNLAEDEKPFNQAEVLVKTWIPLKYITNINTLT
jgi:hypothetical protein